MGLTRASNETTKVYAALTMWGMAMFGVVFSIYLTFLEPFVIGATCAWCITSAIIITLQLIAATGLAKDAWDLLGKQKSTPKIEPDPQPEELKEEENNDIDEEELE